MYRDMQHEWQMGSETGDARDSSNEQACPLSRKFHALALAHGMDFYLVTTFPQADKPEFSANYLTSNWSAELREAYSASDAFGFSRLIGGLKTSIRPKFSTECLFVATQGQAEAKAQEQMFVQSGFKGSLAFSLHDTELNHYVFVFSGQRTEMTAEEQSEIYLGCLELLDTSFGHLQSDGPREKLSARELECLRWSAAGKSSEEIALILNISGHTVISYLKSAMRKLDSVNRMQAIARACRFRLL